MTRARGVGLSATAGSVLLLALLFHPPPLPWTQPLRVSLEAASFGELNPNAGVELGGVRVGSVQGLDVVAGRPVIRIAVDRGYAALLHADASAAIRPHGLLGPRYVELQGGSRGELQDGATIPSSRVQVATDLDQVLNSLQPDVRQSLQTVIVELGTAADGRGHDVNATLQALGAASDDLARVTATLHGRDRELARTVASAEQINRDVQDAPLDAQIRDTDQVLTGLVRVDGAIGDGIDRTAILAQQLDVVMAGNSANLARVLESAPATLARLRAVLVEGTDILDAVNPAVPSLLTATVETKSAFSAADANGHLVRIMVINGACTAGLNLGCSAGSSGRGSAALTGAIGAAGPSASRLSDQDLLRMFLGS